MQARPRLSIVVPAYNEEARILGSLEAAEAYLLKTGDAVEILVVDDGSGDGTPARVERFAGAEFRSSPT